MGMMEEESDMFMVSLPCFFVKTEIEESLRQSGVEDPTIDDVFDFAINESLEAIREAAKNLTKEDLVIMLLPKAEEEQE